MQISISEGSYLEWGWKFFKKLTGARQLCTPRIMYVQYSGGCAVLQWLCSTAVVVQYSGGILSVQRRDVISTAEGYHQYRGGIPSVQRWMFSTAVG